ncbi:MULTISPECIES: hypothetical protein [unclassified Bradyrhizobium]|uniref:hypothetical protein n=1 Tax=unclassified Bradyrhizobium TaxID=2631580 RepID=UPI0029165047|nr:MULTISPECIES: hypothetical protein [unclassified Bradyrhizobium]
MSTSFLVKELDIAVDDRTWPKNIVNPKLKSGSGRVNIDLGEALHELGTITMPNLMSPACPALFWAWLRYYLAPSKHQDLRIKMDFSDLDPHQKGILSDDFGVALATHWVRKRLGPFAQIVDGRKFANQFKDLQRKQNKSKAKVGMSKAPDFVMQDFKGKWHILECKGTQSSREYQKSVLKTAIVQKRAIRLVGSVRGEQLASSVYLTNEDGRPRSNMLVVDPDGDDPLIRLSGQQADEMVVKASRLTVARAMGSIGLNEVAIEMSLPPDIEADSELLLPSERTRLRSDRRDRLARATERARASTLARFEHNSRTYQGRVGLFDLPPVGPEFPYRKVRVRQGVTPELIREISISEAHIDDRVDEVIRPFVRSAKLDVQAAEDQTSVTYGEMFYSDVEWIR